MLLKEFPNLAWLKEKANNRFADRKGPNGQKLEDKGWPTVLLNAKSQYTVRDQIKGPLSIFTNLSGSNIVSTDKSRAKVSHDVFYISNTEQLYSLEITEPVETFNIHIGEKFAESILYSQMHRESYLLDNPEEQDTTSPAFYNKLYWRGDEFNQIVLALQQSQSKLEEHESLSALVQLLIAENFKIRKNEYALDLKKSTRDEIMRRLLSSFDYLYANYSAEINLDDLSKAGCLSKFHFLRLFKQVFHETPHQCLLRLRLEKSKEYLKHPEMDVKTIARKVGFNDSSSFSRSFKKHTNHFPTAFRHLMS